MADDCNRMYTLDNDWGVRCSKPPLNVVRFERENGINAIRGLKSTTKGGRANENYKSIKNENLSK